MSALWPDQIIVDETVFPFLSTGWFELEESLQLREQCKH